MEVDNEIIELIVSEKFDTNFWLFELGRAQKILDESPSIEHQFMNSFFDKGERLWDNYKETLKDFLCDRTHKTIKYPLDELVLGNVRELAVTLYFELTNTHDIIAAIAIPLVAIIIKMGLTNFCAN